METPGEVTNLDNCDREPIHIPGSIQPHGALVAIDRAGRVTHTSTNAHDLLGVHLTIGLPLGAEFLSEVGDPQGVVREAIAEASQSERLIRAVSADLNGASFDVVLHRSGERLVCEFERRDEDADVATFAQLAFRSLDVLKRSDSVQELLDLAVVGVREITGFDRVMAYRFAHDESGEIAAESCRSDLEPYLGRRYPASDIPAQARRLYVLNTLRLIADVAYEPVPILADAGDTEPLDLSQSVLRSVSPIHVEYLGNMGVHASMSASIVVGGKLWGMIACHHMARKNVPYPIRMAVDVMAQVISARVQALTAQYREAAIAQAAWARTEVATAISAGQDILEVLRDHQELLKTTLAADAVLVSLDGTPRLDSGLDPRWTKALADWLGHQPSNLVHAHRADELPSWEEDVARDERFCGLLALRFDEPRQGWIVALRREVVQTIRWGGKPDKVIAHGPLGPRLTPRGSFDEWRETVRDTATPWTAIQLDIASQFMDSVGRAYSNRVVELDAMRAQLWAILGHDLRNPLQSINMASSGIERGANPERLNSIIRQSSHRMTRLLGDVLDMSRLQHGYGLSFDMQQLDLAMLLRQLVDEVTTAHPEVTIAVEIPDTLPMAGDFGRLAQLFANLLSNARHHGQGGITLTADLDDEQISVLVSNRGGPIPDALVPTLFDPFKRSSMQNLRNRTGMGLGLYIAAQVAAGHGGSLDYIPGEGVVGFRSVLPRRLGANESAATESL